MQDTFYMIGSICLPIIAVFVFLICVYLWDVLTVLEKIKSGVIRIIKIQTEK